MNGIPTMYAGVQFRSRLEARWAAFFDLASWRWEYEPFDFPGWIPDFCIWPDERGPLIAEVKPFYEFEQFDAGFYRSRFPSVEQAQAYGVVLLGAGVRRYYLQPKAHCPDEALEAAQLGWFLNPYEEAGKISTAYRFTTPLEYRRREGEERAFFMGPFAEGWEGEGFWREAGNIVQWRGQPQTGDPYERIYDRSRRR